MSHIHPSDHLATYVARNLPLKPPIEKREVGGLLKLSGFYIAP